MYKNVAYEITKRFFTKTERNSFDIMLERFCSVVYLAGLNECYHTKHNIIRFLWIICFTLGFIFTGFFMYGIIDDYGKKPTVTQVTLTKNDYYQYPEMSLAVKKNLKDFSTETNLSREAWLYLQSFENFDDPYNFDPNTRDYEKIIRDFQQYVKMYNFTTVNSFYKFAFRDLFNFVDIQCTACTNFDIYPTEMQHCPYLSFYNQDDAVKFDLILEPYKSVSFKKITNFEASKKRKNILTITRLPSAEDFGGFTFYLMIGSVSDISSRYSMQLFPNSRYDIRMKPQITKRFKTCSESIDTSEAGCRDACLTNAYKKCGNCTMSRYGDGDLASRRTTLCSSLLINVTQCETDQRPFLATCFDRCLPMCEETTFETSGIRKDGDETNGLISVKFVLTSIDNGILTFQEIPSYSMHSAISNVGGQLGLWLGLSVITVCQVILFLFDRFLDWRSSNNTVEMLKK